MPPIAPSEASAPFAAVTFDEFLRQVSPCVSVEWRKYRRRAARHRVEDRMRELGLAGFSAYLERLERDPAEAEALPDRMRVTVSRFFREKERWDLLATHVLPGLLAGKAVRPLRAWSVGCCAGEEPYTLAMLWLDAFANHPVEILATDIDLPSLARAREASYAASSLREVPPALLARRFVSRGGLWQVDEPVRRLVRFEQHNLLTSPPPTDVDLVLCRYLAFTYYRDDRLVGAAQRLVAALRPGGALMIGRDESLPAAAHGHFAPWHECPGCFMRKAISA